MAFGARRVASSSFSKRTEERGAICARARNEACQRSCKAATRSARIAVPGRQLPRLVAAALPNFVSDDSPVQSPPQRTSADRASANCHVAQQAGHASSRRWRDELSGHCRGPGRHRPTGKGATHVGQDRASSAADREPVPAVGGRPEEPLAVTRSWKVALPGPSLCRRTEAQAQIIDSPCLPLSG